MPRKQVTDMINEDATEDWRTRKSSQCSYSQRQGQSSASCDDRARGRNEPF